MRAVSVLLSVMLLGMLVWAEIRSEFITLQGCTPSMMQGDDPTQLCYDPGLRTDMLMKAGDQ